MKEYTSENKSAIIVLHEIYGINNFIDDICLEYHNKEFDVFCSDVLQRKGFLYYEKIKAYNYFFNEIGFEIYKDTEKLAEQLKEKYEKVFILGFSVGATIAWRCCESEKCDGIICCYGSKIRDYLYLQPKCPALLLFAQQDTFDVSSVTEQLGKKTNTEIHTFNAFHGFIDHYSECYDEEQATIAKEYIDAFLKRNNVNERE